jgi:TolB protein
MENSIHSFPVFFSSLIFLLFSTVTVSLSQSQTLGIFEGHSDVGTTVKPGSIFYNAEQQVYTIEGSGTNMWFDRDEFHFVWKRIRGNFILNAEAHFTGSGVELHRKMGWIVRAGLDPNTAHVNATVHGDGLTSLQFRRTTAGNTEEIRLALSGAEIIQLEKQGTTFIMSAACRGEPFTSVQVIDLELGDEVYAGIYVCAHNKDVMEKAVFQNVRIVIPAGENFIPYQNYIGSNLEILDIESGHRKIIYLSPASLQAPNWTPDGQSLIYNSQGRLYRYDLTSGTIDSINTDFATNNNNDHVLSFDGKMLGISHHSSEDQNKSIIYTLPVLGGLPRRVTSKGPSYLHGWSPDNRYLVYTGERNGEYDIYRIPAEGGDERRLTDAKGLDDGSEYTPDGAYIYFNSNRNGTMQIWRMQTDGSNQEQITNDNFNNWFPHISPDGKWMVFLSYLPDVNPGDHPFYKQVYLRLLPVSGRKPRIVAYLYGGQGTINVPSWSPDSKKIAFVSNTCME